MDFEFKTLRRFFGVGPVSRRRRNEERIRDIRQEMDARREARSGREVPRREMVIALFASLALVSTPWMLGGQPLWAALITLFLAAMAFAFLFVPLQDATEELSASPRESWHHVTRCVPFWCGAVIVVMMLIQGLNPRLEVSLNPDALWEVLPVESFVSWLPTGVRAPFAHEGTPGGMNAFRAAILFAAPWLLFTALWCGIRSRRVVRVLAWMLVISAVVAAVLAISMRTVGTSHAYSGIKPGQASPYGPFLYQNQAGAYFYVMAMFGATLGLREWIRSARMDRRGGPQLIALCVCICVFSAALVSASFGAVVASIVSLVVLVPAIVLTAFRARPSEPTPMRDLLPNYILVGLLVVGFGVLIARQGDFRGMAEKVRHKLEMSRAETLDDRKGLREATLKLYAAAPAATGAGAGSYRWIAPKYFAQVPEFCDAHGRVNKYALYAHNDWLQILAEWGWVGLGTVVTALLWLLWRLRSIWRLANVALWPAFGITVILFLHAALDYLFFNPGVAVTAVFVVFYLLVSLRKSAEPAAPHDA